MADAGGSGPISGIRSLRPARGVRSRQRPQQEPAAPEEESDDKSGKKKPEQTGGKRKGRFIDERC